MKKEEFVVKDSDELKRSVHQMSQDDKLEEAELCLLVDARKDQDEIEVDINTL